MELLLILRILRRWWWLVAIPVLITAALALPSLLNRGAASGGFTQTITYSAMQQLDAIPRSEGDYQDIWLSSELTVNAFTDWVRGSAFKQEIGELVPDAEPGRARHRGGQRPQRRTNLPELSRLPTDCKRSAMRR